MNVMLIFGLPYGIFVMVFDVLKAFVACKIVTVFFPQNPYVGMVAGVASIVVAVLSWNILLAFIASLGSFLILWKHAQNIVKAKNGTDVKIRQYIVSLFRNKEN